jgi:hypothetical protein
MMKRRLNIKLNTLTINNYCDVSTGHWKLHYFSNASVYLTEEYMGFLDVEDWDALEVTDNEDGTVTLKGYNNETKIKEELSSKI